jgi:glyoxylase I family protein
MHILGLTFAGTSTSKRLETARFFRDTLGLTGASVEGVEADLFKLPDGSTFAVASPGGMGDTSRSVGFLVDDLDDAIERLRMAGVATDAVAQNAQQRYVHFRAPDHQLYELIEKQSR